MSQDSGERMGHGRCHTISTKKCELVNPRGLSRVFAGRCVRTGIERFYAQKSGFYVLPPDGEKYFLTETKVTKIAKVHYVGEGAKKKGLSAGYLGVNPVCGGGPHGLLRSNVPFGTF